MLENAKFHGESFNEKIDRPRLQGQLERIYKVLEFGEVWDCETLSKMSNVSMGSVPKRISDLRVYHGYIIECKRLKKGLFSYQLKGKMNDKEFADFKKQRQLDSYKPVGDQKLFNELMRALYAYANKKDSQNKRNCKLALFNWANDMIEKIKGEKNAN